MGGGVIAAGRVVGGGMEKCSEKGTNAERDTVIEGGKGTERGQMTIAEGVAGKEVGAADDPARSPGIGTVGMRSVACQGTVEGTEAARVTTRTTEKDDVPVPSIQTTTALPHQAKQHPGDSKKICTLPVLIEIGHRTGMARKAQTTWKVGVCKGRLPPSVSGRLHPKDLRGNCPRWDRPAGNPSATAQRHPVTWTLILNRNMSGGSASVKTANVESIGSTGRRQGRKGEGVSVGGRRATKAAAMMSTGASGSQGARARVNNLVVPVRAGRHPARSGLRKRSGSRSLLLLQSLRRPN